MSKTHQEYKSALFRSEKHLSPAVGFVSTTAEANTVASSAKQSNTIIELLLSLHDKIDILTSQVENIRKNTFDPEKQLGEITSQIANLKLGTGTSTQPVVRKEPGNITVWRDPKAQIETFRKTQR